MTRSGHQWNRLITPALTHRVDKLDTEKQENSMADTRTEAMEVSSKAAITTTLMFDTSVAFAVAAFMGTSR